ncbi:MFS transporter, partial [Nesterenkonia haasae]|uniref:MFS transporter n=1 Tax=Nesterenkonia haasae TaxID=2587813 RepID=UPI00139208F7
MSSSSSQGLLYLLRSGGAPLMLIGLIGRLPTAMIPMLLLVAIPLAGGSQTQAGSAVGISALGTAVSGFAVGLLIDRFGARPVVLMAAIIQGSALLGLAAQFSNLDDVPFMLPLAFLVGVSNPAIGALAKAEWVRRTEVGELDPAAVRSALAWEASSSEASFVLGPVVASLLLGVIEPRMALVTVAVTGFVVHLEFVRQVPLRTTGSPGASINDQQAASRSVFSTEHLRRPGMVVMAALLVAMAVGLVFGSVQASLNAVFAGLGVPALVGPVYGIMGVGSIIGGLVWAQ